MRKIKENKTAAMVVDAYGLWEHRGTTREGLAFMTRQSARWKASLARWRKFGFDDRGRLPRGCPSKSKTIIALLPSSMPQADAPSLGEPEDATADADLIVPTRSKPKSASRHDNDGKTKHRAIFPFLQGYTPRNWLPITPSFNFIDLVTADGGIPPSIQGQVWAAALGVPAALRERPHYYTSLIAGVDERIPERAGVSWKAVSQTKTKHPEDWQIWIDVKRTFADHPKFNVGTAQAWTARESLFRVCKAFVLQDEFRGMYTQGMNLLAGLLLLTMDEESAFWALDRMMRSGLKDLFSAEFVGLKAAQARFSKAFEKRMPRLAKHLESVGMLPSMYTTGWFLTSFLYNLGVEEASRVWDVFIVVARGKPAFLEAMGLAILGHLERSLMRARFDELNELLIRIPLTRDAIPRLCRVALKISGDMAR